MKKITIILIIAALTGCSRSLVYSPSIHLTNEPLKEKEVDLQGAAELLPETRPEALPGNGTTMGFSAQLSYGFSDQFNLTAKGWADVEGRENLYRSGYSLNAQFIRPIDERRRLILLPRAGFALDGDDFQGYGLAMSVIYHSSLNKKLSWYGGAGLGWGFRYLEKDTNAEDEERLPMGLGIIANLGIGWQITHTIRLNAELNPIYQLNTFDQNSQFLLSPSVGIGLTLNKKAKE